MFFFFSFKINCIKVKRDFVVLIRGGFSGVFLVDMSAGALADAVRRRTISML